MAKNRGEKPEMIPMRIDTMQLTLGRVIFKDYSQGEEPKIQVFDVGGKTKPTKISPARISWPHWFCWKA